MANFNTHITVAAVASGLLASSCQQLGLVSASDAGIMAILGTIGGILPDIDSENSRPSQILFSMLGMSLGLLWIFSFMGHYPLPYLWLVGAGIYFTIHYPFRILFHKYTTHRGAFHSLLTALMFVFIIAAISDHLFHKEPISAWLIAISIGFGFVVHLLLDEIYSVDLADMRLKKSFGTALKIVDTRQVISSSIIGAIALIAYIFSPPFIPLIQKIAQSDWSLIFKLN